MKKKVVVGMSGGVDSSVAAALLKEKGYDVIGVTMQIWQKENYEENPDNGACCGLSAVEDARRVAAVLGIPYYVMNFRDVFREKVIDNFIDEYVNGRTPNPCVVCNRFVKWEALLRRAIEIGTDYIATGHYARVEELPNGRFAIKNSVTAMKDQTYALYNLTQFQLAHTLMPVGDYTKDEIRRIAMELNLPIANKPDSQDICFIPDGDYGAFLEKEAGGRLKGPGNFISEDGKILGRHKGIVNYTVGQRKGLNLSLGKPVFVSEIKPDTNEVVISERDVYSDSLICDKVNFMSIEDLKEPLHVRAKVRYAHRGEECTIEKIGEDIIKCTFDKPVRAITPGQACVFYDGEYVLGGGTIR